MTFNTVHEAIDTLNQAFAEFKSANDERLSLLERKGSADVLIENKLAYLNTQIDKTCDVLSRLERLRQRPVMGEGIPYPESSKDHHDFLTYLRKGQDIPLQLKKLSGETSGGILVPPTLANQIYSNLKVVSPLRDLAHVTAITSHTLEVIMDKGGEDVGWVSEVAEREETPTPELAKVRIPTHEIYAKPRVSQRLLDDNHLNIEQWLVDKVAHKMASVENSAFIKGDGEGKPRGLLSYPSVEAGRGEWGKFEHLILNPDKNFIQSDVLIMVLSAVKSFYLPGCSWLMSRSAQGEIRKLKDPATHAYLWQPSLAAGMPNTLLGYPVAVMEEMPSLQYGTSPTPIIFGNFRAAYQIVDRLDMHVLRDPYSAKPYIEFYATKRVGGDVIDFQAVKFLMLITGE